MITTLQAAVIVAPMLGLVAVALLWGDDKPTDAEDVEQLARDVGVLREPDLDDMASAAEAARAAEQCGRRWLR